MRRTAIVVLLVTGAFAQDGRKARDLASRARSAALEYDNLGRADVLIAEALRLWDRSNEPKDAEYARALDLAGMLHALRIPDDEPGAVRVDVEPLYRQALDILDHAPALDNKADLALALELEALALDRIGRNDEAIPLRARAAGIRKRIVETIQGRLTVQDFLDPVPQRIGRGVTAPRANSRIDPGYSHEARLAKRQGTVVLSVVVTERGYPASLRLIRSLGFGLDEEAVHAVRQWRFEPGTKDGEPVPVQATIEVSFRVL
jgi:TonB family protein